MDFNGKIVVITGGTSGMGLCIVIALFELETTNSIKVFDELQKQYGNRIDFYPCDITNTSQLEGYFNNVLKKYNAIDILINNAGIFDENNPSRLVDTNYKAVLLGSLMMIDRVGKHKGGKGGLIINIASVVGLYNFEFFPIYSSTKHAVISFTRSMKAHNDKTGVRVIALCPGTTNTRMIDDLYKLLDFIDAGEKFKAIPNMQSPECIATAVVDFVMVEGKSGDVWVAEESQPPYIVKAVEDYKNLRVN